MDRDTLEALDFYRIRGEVASFCAGDEGRAALLAREPLSDEAQIERLKNLSCEWQTYFSSGKGDALLAYRQVGGLFKIIKTDGAALELEEAHALLTFCASVKNFAEKIMAAREEISIPHLAEAAQSFPDLSIPLSLLSRVVTKDGELRDIAELRELKSRIFNINKKMAETLRAYTSDPRLASALESNLPVLRGGREVLAVKISHKNKVRGIIHDVSQSGKTVYIEPDALVAAGNELVEAEAQLKAAVREIFKKLTAELAPYAVDFENALSMLTTLDACAASARWGMAHDCSYALACSEDEPLALLGARHPLIENAVPIDVRLAEGKRVLIITGPNAGGKTAALKTVALLALLNQSGFPIPASEGSRLPIFDNVFADIGDGQSLDESLSTFSAKMRRIANAVSLCDEKSLVLLDELGSGTDAQEGSALAMATLDALIEKNALVLVTTHQGALKNYGWTRGPCMNASVEFDGASLSPTYRLKMGVPGESRAFDIARKSGLDASIISKAERYAQGGESDIALIIANLTAKHKEADALLQNCKQRERELGERENALDEKSFALQKKEHEINLDAQSGAEQFLREARSKLENLVRTVREGELTKDKTLAVRYFLDGLERNVKAKRETLENEAAHISETERAMQEKIARQNAGADGAKGASGAGNAAAKNAFKVGDAVLAGKSRKSGILISDKGKGSKWLVGFGDIQIVMKESELLPTAQNRHTSAPLVAIEESAINKSDAPVFELRLLGMRSAEAIKALERQLDLCVLCGLSNFSVIHGKGNGVLQQAVRDYLSHSDFVKEFHFASAEDGGAGKTYVTMR